MGDREADWRGGGGVPRRRASAAHEGRRSDIACLACGRAPLGWSSGDGASRLPLQLPVERLAADAWSTNTVRGVAIRVVRRPSKC